MIKVIRYCTRCGAVVDEKCYYAQSLYEEDGRGLYASLCRDCQKALDDMKEKQREELRKFWEESEDWKMKEDEDGTV